MNEADMNDANDYLWTAEGPEDLEVAGLERALEDLRWRASALALQTHLELVAPEPAEGRAPASASAANARPAQPSSLQIRPLGRASQWWPAAAAAIVAAAAVTVAMLWLRPPPAELLDDERPIPIAPAASPLPPELEDPFPGAAPALEDPSSTGSGLVDPFTRDPLPSSARTYGSPDLKDPFAAPSERGPKLEPEARRRGARNSRPARPSSSPRARYPELKDPFAERSATTPAAPPALGEDPQAIGDAQRSTGQLFDPFAAQPRPTALRGPEIKDPFSER
ncbi:hypothetical protein G6O69_14465 [Pseudenhygromyxa sp. WMMC2535]|uniref:hypothetical protein n=1 Tax=Pseudenhygromyxa sp. WMMC2535 TaxID=2712867 RepID=UPI00155735EF|nr:hypothetical protein [Pseudenhygromyxa sp. WMMC2535]NVB39043.1 hypothetical protein [Pseudenhygromyxa sp. WMMC2535]